MMVWQLHLLSLGTTRLLSDCVNWEQIQGNWVYCQNIHTPSEAMRTKHKHTVTNCWLIKCHPNHGRQENGPVSGIFWLNNNPHSTDSPTHCRGNGYNFLASLGVVHPVQNDLGSPVPTGHHVARHLSISTAGQAEVQNLEQKQKDHNTENPMYHLFITKIMLWYLAVIHHSTNLQFTVLIYSQVSRFKIL